MDIAAILDRLVPEADYGGSLTANTREAYDALRWMDKREKPSWDQIVSAHNLWRERPSAPDEITNFQARVLLLQMASPFRKNEDDERTMFDDADDFCRKAGGAVWQAWEYANVFQRRGLLVETIKNLWGLTDDQVSAMFIQASRIEP
jgi:hypothetical protein